MAGQPNFPELPDDAVAPDSALVYWRSFRRALAYLRAITPLPGKGIQLSEDAQGVRIAARPPAVDPPPVINPGFLVQQVGTEDAPVLRIWGGRYTHYVKAVETGIAFSEDVADGVDVITSVTLRVPGAIALDVSAGYSASTDRTNQSGLLARPVFYDSAELGYDDYVDVAISNSNANTYVHLNLSDVNFTGETAEIRVSTTFPSRVVTAYNPNRDSPVNGEYNVILSQYAASTKKITPHVRGLYALTSVISVVTTNEL